MKLSQPGGQVGHVPTLTREPAHTENRSISFCREFIPRIPREACYDPKTRKSQLEQRTLRAGSSPCADGV
jgi:hypothetical protein